MVATQLTILVVNGIIGAIEMLFCDESAVRSNKPAKSHPRVEKVTVIKEVPRQPSRRELKEREKSHYYLICHMTKDGKPANKLINLRVDRFVSVDILANKKALDIREIPEYRNGNFQLDEYMRQHLYMVTGNTVNVVMKIKRDRIEDFIDWYGKNYMIVGYESDEEIIRFSVNENALRYWALQYSSIATVLEPASLVKTLGEDTELLVKKYGKM